MWAGLPDEGYSVCWDTSNNNACDTTWWPNGGATTKLIQDLTPGTYYWQVKRASDGAEANSGSWWAFTVGTPAVTFDKQTPGAGAILTTNTVPLRWTTAPGASFYETCLDQTNNGVCDAGWQNAAQATKRTVSGLANGLYYWQVRAQTATGMTEANGGTWWVIKVDMPTPSRDYIYLGSTLLAEITYSMTAPPVLTYYHTDLLGSVRAVTDTSGATVTRHDYFPFGESTSPLTGDPRRFTGKELDPETAFQYFGARYYRNVWGRFTSLDPAMAIRDNAVDPQRWNRFAHALNNPLKYVDPDGRNPVLAAAALLWAAYEVASTAYDAYTAAKTLRDPDASSAEKSVAVAGAIAGIGLPGGGYGSAGRAILRQADELGTWTRVSESMSAGAAAYQSRISGRGLGEAFVVNGTRFDGVAGDVLLEAKGPGYAKFVSKGRFLHWFDGAPELVQQARRQLKSAKGSRIQWHFAEESAAEATRALFKANGIEGIEILYTRGG